MYVIFDAESDQVPVLKMAGRDRSHYHCLATRNLYGTPATESKIAIGRYSIITIYDVYVKSGAPILQENRPCYKFDKNWASAEKERLGRRETLYPTNGCSLARLSQIGLNQKRLGDVLYARDGAGIRRIP